MRTSKGDLWFLANSEYEEEDDQPSYIVDDMERLDSVDTHLPVYIYVDDSMRYLREHERKNVKVLNRITTRISDHGEELVGSDVFSISISANPEIINGEQSIEFSKGVLDRVIAFVRNNWKLLDDLADMKIGFVEFYSNMIRDFRPLQSKRGGGIMEK